MSDEAAPNDPAQAKADRVEQLKREIASWDRRLHALIQLDEVLKEKALAARESSAGEPGFAAEGLAAAESHVSDGYDWSDYRNTLFRFCSEQSVQANESIGEMRNFIAELERRLRLAESAAADSGQINRT